MKAQFARFLMVGGIAAAANIASRALFGLWMLYIPAIVLAYGVGIVTAFLLNRRWVFEPSGRSWRSEMRWFLLINLLGVAQTVLVAWLLARHVLPWAGFPAGALLDTVAHAAGVAAPIITSFIGHKHVTFRRRRPLPVNDS
jgi:putative flippase GtrA